ncbi:MAG TPA: hypothetical protein QGH10_03300 [Armatimonadota bacterium]|nr:hypothetical protein [Armatimonadota bacterium]
MLPERTVQFDLLQSGKDSLRHALEHVGHLDMILGSHDSGDLKASILSVAQPAELLLKERLRRVHPRFVWRDPDDYPRTPAFTVNITAAMDRLKSIAGIRFSPEAEVAIRRARTLRNAATHGDFAVDALEMKELIGDVLSFVFWFAREHLESDLEAELRAEPCYQASLMVYELWAPHAISLEQQLRNAGKHLAPCPECAATTYLIEDSHCALCGSDQRGVECPRCGITVPETDCISMDAILPDGSVGVVHYCVHCIPGTTNDGP